MLIHIYIQLPVEVLVNLDVFFIGGPHTSHIVRLCRGAVMVSSFNLFILVDRLWHHNHWVYWVCLDLSRLRLREVSVKQYSMQEEKKTGKKIVCTNLNVRSTDCSI